MEDETAIKHSFIHLFIHLFNHSLSSMLRFSDWFAVTVSERYEDKLVKW